MGFHIWLPMDGFFSTIPILFVQILIQLYFPGMQNPTTITAYNDKDDSLYISASRGNNRLGISKPDVAPQV